MRSWLWNKKLPRSKKTPTINNDSSQTGKDTEDLESMQSEEIINSLNPTTIKVKVQPYDREECSLLSWMNAYASPRCKVRGRRIHRNRGAASYLWQCGLLTAEIDTKAQSHIYSWIRKEGQLHDAANLDELLPEAIQRFPAEAIYKSSLQRLAQKHFNFRTTETDKLSYCVRGVVSSRSPPQPLGIEKTPQNESAHWLRCLPSDAKDESSSSSMRIFFCLQSGKELFCDDQMLCFQGTEALYSREDGCDDRKQLNATRITTVDLPSWTVLLSWSRHPCSMRAPSLNKGLEDNTEMHYFVIVVDVIKPERENVRMASKVDVLEFEQLVWLSGTQEETAEVVKDDSEEASKSLPSEYQTDEHMAAEEEAILLMGKLKERHSRRLSSMEYNALRRLQDGQQITRRTQDEIKSLLRNEKFQVGQTSSISNKSVSIVGRRLTAFPRPNIPKELIVDADDQSDPEISNEDGICVEQEEIEESSQKGIGMNKGEEEEGDFLWSTESSKVLENFRMSLVNDTEDA